MEDDLFVLSTSKGTRVHMSCIPAGHERHALYTHGRMGPNNILKHLLSCSTRADIINLVVGVYDRGGGYIDCVFAARDRVRRIYIIYICIAHYITRGEVV